MMVSLFTIYFLAMVSIFAEKKKMAVVLLTIGLLFGIFLLWFHATDKLGINL